MPAFFGLIHLFALFGLTFSTARRLFSGNVGQLSATFLLLWANLVYTALLLACITKLDSRLLYFGISLALASLVYGLVKRRAVTFQPLALAPEVASEPLAKLERIFLAFLGATLSLAALGTLIICLRYYATNWDSIAYRFSRVFFYLGQGHLLHFAKGVDPRALNYPFNGTLAYLFPATYGFDGVVFNLLSLACWAASGAGIYLLSRVLGASRFGSYIAVWLCLMAPIVLCVAASTNDEILAAAPTVVGLVFVVRALREWSKRCIVLGAVGLGIGFGVKLHWLFFAPLLGVAALVAVIALLRSKQALLIWKKRLPELAMAAGLALPLVGGFAICNLLSTGHLTDTAFMTSAINSPFRFDVARQKVWINSTQLLISGIPDLPINFDPEARKLPYAKFNKWLNEGWFSDVNQDEAFRVAAYRFQGIADPAGFNYFEQTLWVGFLPILMLLAILLGLIRRNVPIIALAAIASFFIWHLSYAAQTRYAEAISTYYSYPAILSCAGLGIVFDRMRWHNGLAGKLLFLVLGAVVASHLLFDFNLLAFNAQRNLPQALSAGFKGVTPVTQVSDKAAEAIRRSQRIHIPYLHWELLYWNYMRQNPLARYSTGWAPRNEPGLLNLFSLEANIESGKLVARYPASGPDGLVYLGAGYGGGELIFASGDGVEKQYPGDRNYFIVPVTLSRRPENQSLAIVSIDSNGVTGLGPADGVEFRVVAEGPNGLRRPSRWMTPAKGTETIELDPAKPVTGIVVEARIAADPSKACTISNGLPSIIRPEQSICTANGGGQLLLTLAPDVPGTESTNWGGTNYTVRWLKQHTRFTVQNPGAEAKAEIRMQLGINVKPKLAMLSYDGGKTPGQKIEKFLWAQGPQPVQFTVKVKPGENRFVLSTAEPADPLSDGRPGALLLIGEMGASTDEAPEQQTGLKRTKMNCYCGRTEAAATAAYRSMQLDGGKAIAGLFERNELIEIQGQLPVKPESISGTLAKLLVKGGPHANSTCWLPANLIE